MNTNVLKKILKSCTSIGLALLVLGLLWLYLTSGLKVGATAPIAGDPVSTGGGSLILTANDAVAAVIAADLDNDSHADLAFGDGVSVRILANQSTTGTISWAPPPGPTIVTMGTPVVALAAADWDRDGHMDLAVAAANTAGIGGIRLQRNPNPDPPFTTAWSQGRVLTSAAQLSLTSIVAGDLDADGAPDLASAGGDGVIRLWHNPLTNTSNFGTAWGTPASIPTSDGRINQLVLADIDRDGRLDIVAVSGGSARRVRAWRNPGAPFSNAWSTTNLLGNNLSADGLSLSVADLDHDGAPDVAAGLADGSVLAWHNPLTGSQPFNTSWGSPVVIEGAGAGPVETLQAADLDYDGYPELIRGTAGVSPSLVVWHSRRAPFAGNWLSHTAGTPSSPLRDLATADLDRDGDTDLVSGGANALLHWPNVLLHRSSPFGNQTLVGQQGTIQVLTVGDLDRDGLPDLVSASYGGDITLWHNDGTPFGSDWPSLSWDSYRQIRSLALADLDGDGYLDIVTGHAYGPPDSELYVWHNDGTPFDARWTDTLIGTIPDGDYDDNWARVVAPGDLDRDGNVDIVIGTGGDFGRGITDPVTRSTDFGLFIWRNDGNPFSSTSWSSSSISVTLDAVNAVALGDLDDDGRLDVVAGTNHAPALGTEEEPVDSTFWIDAYELRAFRNDGTPFNGHWPDFDIGRDPETYTFAAGPVYHGYFGASTYAVALADLDNDGDLDIASGDSWAADYQVKVWENDGTPFDGELWDFSITGLGPWWETDGDPWLSGGILALTSADVNQDGYADLATGFQQSAFPVKVIYWENSGLPFSAVVTEPTWIRHNIGITVNREVRGVVAADLDRDGDMDLAAAARGTGQHVYAWQNQGGAVSEYAASTAPTQVAENTQDDLLRVAVAHNGRWADHDVELAWWRLTLANGAGTPLTGVQAANLFDQVRVYRDNGNGTWQVPADTLVVSVPVINTAIGSGGLLTIPFSADDPLTTLSIGQQATYFVVVMLQPDASVHEPPAFQMSFDPDAASLVYDATTMSSVSIEDTDPVTVGPVSISAGPPASVGVVASASVITADGVSTAAITATVTNAAGRPVDDGTLVSFATNLGSIGPPTGVTTNGIAKATLTSATTLGYATVTATAGTATGNTQVRFASDEPDQVVVTARPTSIVADGTSTAVITATVTDAFGHLVRNGTLVTFSSSRGSISPSALTTNGVAIATLTSSTRAGTVTITARAGNASGTGNVQFVAGPLAKMSLEAGSDSLVANGTATTVITATLMDVNDNPISEARTVTFSTTLGTVFPTSDVAVNGIATTTLQASTTEGTATVTAWADGLRAQTTVTFAPESFTVYLPGILHNAGGTYNQTSLVAEPGSLLLISEERVAQNPPMPERRR